MFIQVGNPHLVPYTPINAREIQNGGGDCAATLTGSGFSFTSIYPEVDHIPATPPSATAEGADSFWLNAKTANTMLYEHHMEHVLYKWLNDLSLSKSVQLEGKHRGTTGAITEIIICSRKQCLKNKKSPSWCIKVFTCLSGLEIAVTCVPRLVKVQQDDPPVFYSVLSV